MDLAKRQRQKIVDDACGLIVRVILREVLCGAKPGDLQVRPILYGDGTYDRFDPGHIGIARRIAEGEPDKRIGVLHGVLDNAPVLFIGGHHVSNGM